MTKLPTLAQVRDDLFAKALQVHEGDTLRFDGDCLHRTQGDVLPCAHIPDFLMDMVQAGGLLNVLKQQAQQANSR